MARAILHARSGKLPKASIIHTITGLHCVRPAIQAPADRSGTISNHFLRMAKMGRPAQATVVADSVSA